MPHSENQNVSPERTVINYVPGTSFVVCSPTNDVPYRVWLDPALGKNAKGLGYRPVFFLDGNSVSLPSKFFGDTELILKEPESCLFVRVGYDTDDRELIKRLRYKDLTPTPSETSQDKLYQWGVSDFGGADRFIDIFETDIKLTISKTYNIDYSNSILVGHSLGGLFTLYAFLKRPEICSKFLAGSPSIWWNKKLLTDIIETHSLNDRNQHVASRLFINVGSEEPQSMRDDACLIADRISSTREKALVRFQTISGVDHASMFEQTIEETFNLLFPRT